MAGPSVIKEDIGAGTQAAAEPFFNLSTGLIFSVKIRKLIVWAFSMMCYQKWQENFFYPSGEREREKEKAVKTTQI